MRPKGAFTLERVQRFAAVAADGARTRLAEDGTPHVDHLSCEYKGVVTEDGAYDINDEACHPCVRLACYLLRASGDNVGTGKMW